MNASEIWFEAAVLGLVQGLTEFLPVSSSAHLRIVGSFLPSGQDPGAAFTAISQIGTEAAVLLYFRRDVWGMLTAWLLSVGSFGRQATEESRMAWLILLGTLPIVFLGLAFRDAIETGLRNLYITSAMLIVFGLLLGLADRVGAKRRDVEQVTATHGLLLGLGQALALVPGVSRSGGTISVGLALGYTREAAARYSFLLAIPAVFASGFYQLWKSWGQFGFIGPGPTLLATAIAFVVGYAVIVVFLRIVSKGSYLPFVVYRVILGAILLMLLGAGIVSA